MAVCSDTQKELKQNKESECVFFSNSQQNIYLNLG